MKIASSRKVASLFVSTSLLFIGVPAVHSSVSDKVLENRNEKTVIISQEKAGNNGRENKAEKNNNSNSLGKSPSGTSIDNRDDKGPSNVAAGKSTNTNLTEIFSNESCSTTLSSERGDSSNPKSMSSGNSNAKSNGDSMANLNTNPNNGKGKQVINSQIIKREGVGSPSGKSVTAINVLLKRVPTHDEFSSLSKFGRVVHQIHQLKAVTMVVSSSELGAIASLDFVAAANADAARCALPITQTDSIDLEGGVSTWNLDQINVTDGVGSGNRVVDRTGSGTYVAVLDTGLVKNWPYYFGDAIAAEYAAAFGGGGGERGAISRQPNKWGLDQDSHGTHVTSTILGFRHPDGSVVGGVAPNAKVIPVKVLSQAGWGWSSVIAEGITYVADLKMSDLSTSPVVINMSLGGPALDAIEKAAIDYAISKGVIVVASAGNNGDLGMGYPGAYDPVISVAASGWRGEWQASSWWRTANVAENGVTDAYITEFSSRAKSTPIQQYLDIAAPGSWIVGPYQTNGQLSAYYLGGTSMASPHVAGIVALMTEKKSSLSQAEAESILKSTAWPMGIGSMTITQPSGITKVVSWGADATGSGLVNASLAIAHTPNS